jgi:uncharacterized protein YpmB
MKNRRNIYNYRLHEGAMDSFCPALAVTENEVKDLVNVTLTDDNAKSIYIYAEPDSMIGDEIEEQIESYLNATVEDVSNEFLAVVGEEIDANFINSALRGTGDENFDNITTIFVANAENADVSVLSKLGIEYKVIAVASVVGPEEMEDTCNALGNAYECFDCSDAADLLSGKAENFDIDYDNEDDYYDDSYSLDDLGESVSSRFAKYARLYEDLNEDDDTDDTEDSDKDNDNDSDDDVEDVDVSAVVVTVNKDDVDKCKDELIAAGVSEDDIEVLDDDNEDSDNTDIKIDVNSIVEVKDWIENKKGEGAFKDLTGIEIVDSDDDSDSEDDREPGDKSDADELSDDDFDFGDIFANAEKDGKEK